MPVDEQSSSTNCCDRYRARSDRSNHPPLSRSDRSIGSPHPGQSDRRVAQKLPCAVQERLDVGSLRKRAGSRRYNNGERGFTGTPGADDGDQAGIESDCRGGRPVSAGDRHLLDYLRRHGRDRRHRPDEGAAPRIDANLAQRVERRITFYPAEAVPSGAPLRVKL